MTFKQTGIIGILTLSLFVISFILFFAFYPQNFKEINNLSLGGYNVTGAKGQLFIQYVTYISVGFLNLLVAFGLFKIAKNNAIIIVGKILLFFSGLLWISFGVTSITPGSETGIWIMFIKVIAILIFGAVSLIILGAEFERIIKDNFLKYYTLASGIVILIAFVSQITLFSTESFILINLAIIIYFSWFGVLGFRIIQITSKKSNRLNIS